MIFRQFFPFLPLKAFSMAVSETRNKKKTDNKKEILESYSLLLIQSM